MGACAIISISGPQAKSAVGIDKAMRPPAPPVPYLQDASIFPKLGACAGKKGNGKGAKGGGSGGSKGNVQTSKRGREESEQQIPSSQETSNQQLSGGGNPPSQDVEGPGASPKRLDIIRSKKLQSEKSIPECEHFVKGHCKRGHNCKFKHTVPSGKPFDRPQDEPDRVGTHGTATLNIGWKKHKPEAMPEQWAESGWKSVGQVGTHAHIEKPSKEVNDTMYYQCFKCGKHGHLMDECQRDPHPDGAAAFQKYQMQKYEQDDVDGCAYGDLSITPTVPPTATPNKPGPSGDNKRGQGRWRSKNSSPERNSSEDGRLEFMRREMDRANAAKTERKPPRPPSPPSRQHEKRHVDFGDFTVPTSSIAPYVDPKSLV